MMELFSLGADRGAYTETDVREQARALTGWTAPSSTGSASAFAFVDASRRGVEDDLRPERQLHLAGLVPTSASTTRCTRRSSSTRCGATSSRRRPTTPPPPRSQTNLREHGSGAAGGRGDPAASRLLRRAAHGQAAGRPQRRAAAHAGRYVDTSAWWTQSAAAGQQLFYPPDVGGWDYTRWLDTSRWRARWFIAALVQGAGGADRQLERPDGARAERDPVLGQPDDLVEDADAARGVRQGPAEAERSRRNVETALRRLVASSPDLQTA